MYWTWQTAAWIKKILGRNLTKLPTQQYTLILYSCLVFLYLKTHILSRKKLQQSKSLLARCQQDYFAFNYHDFHREKKNPCILWSTGTDERVWWQIFFVFFFIAQILIYTCIIELNGLLIIRPEGSCLRPRKNRKHNIFTILHHSFTKKQWKIPAHSHIVIKTNEWPSQKLVSCKIPYLSSTHSPIFFNWTLNKKVRLLFFLFFLAALLILLLLLMKRKDEIWSAWCDAMAWHTHTTEFWYIVSS